MEGGGELTNLFYHIYSLYIDIDQIFFVITKYHMKFLFEQSLTCEELEWNHRNLYFKICKKHLYAFHFNTKSSLILKQFFCKKNSTNIYIIYV